MKFYAVAISRGYNSSSVLAQPYRHGPVADINCGLGFFVLAKRTQRSGIASCAVQTPLPIVVMGIDFQLHCYNFSFGNSRFQLAFDVELARYRKNTFVGGRFFQLKLRNRGGGVEGDDYYNQKPNGRTGCSVGERFLGNRKQHPLLLCSEFILAKTELKKRR